MSKPLLLVLVLGVCACRGSDAPEEGEAPAPALTFLNEPAGVAPDPMVPLHLEVTIRAAVDEKLARGRLVDAADLWPPVERAPVDAFLEKHRRWFARMDALRQARDAVKAGQPEPALEPIDPVLPISAPIVRARFAGPEAIRREHLLALPKGGARGNLVLWYAWSAVRERLFGGGVAGLWRGVTRFRDGLPGTGPKLGGTPVLMLGALAAIDAPLLDGKAPAGFATVMTADAWLGPLAERDERRALLRDLGATPPTAAELPEMWKALFRAPDGTDVVWLVPSGTDVMGGDVDAALEGLTPLVKQGARAWLLIALPLAEERKEERF